jgi:hypothetical protein
VGKLLAKYSPGKPIKKWEDSNKVYLRETGYVDGTWMELNENSVQWWVFVLAALKFGRLV